MADSSGSARVKPPRRGGRGARPSRWLMSTCALSAVLFAASACQDAPLLNPVAEETGEATVPEGSLEVSISAGSTQLHPGQTTVLTAEASPSAGASVDYFDLYVGGVFVDTVQLPVEPEASLHYTTELNLPVGPIEGVLEIKAVAAVGETIARDSVSISIVDDGPPKVGISTEWLRDPGDSLIIRYSATDAAGVLSLLIRVCCVVNLTQVDSFDLRPGVEDTARLHIPLSTPLEDSVLVEVAATDGFQKHTLRRGLVRVTDNTPPTLTAAFERVQPIPFENHVRRSATPILLPGDTVRISLTGEDPRLRWLGYRFFHVDVHDSVPVADSSASAFFELVVPGGFQRTDGAAIQMFARDSYHLEESILGRATPVPAVRGPITAKLHGVNAPFPPGRLDQNQDMTYDAKRDLLFFHHEGHRFVTVFSVASLDYLPPLETPGVVLGVDLAAGGDSLVMLLDTEPCPACVHHLRWLLGVVDLTAPSWQVDTLQLWPIQVNRRRPRRVKVGADNRAIISLEKDLDQPDSTAYEVDLSTGARRFRAVRDWPTYLTVSPDRSVIVAWDGRRAALYRPAFGTFEPPQTVRHSVAPSLSYDASSILIGHRLYDGDLSTSVEIGPSNLSVNHALAMDGSRAFYRGVYSYKTFLPGEQTEQERVFLPRREPTQVIALPDGKRLLVFARGGWAGVAFLQ